MNRKQGLRLPPRDPKGGRPTQDVAAKLVTHILDVALEHFSRRGAEKVSMEEIAALANVSKRTLYARFGSKLGLVHAALQHGVDTLLRPMVRTIPDAPLSERLLQLGRRLLEFSMRPEVVGMEELVYWFREQRGDLDESLLSRVGPKELLDEVAMLLEPHFLSTNMGAEEREAIAAHVCDVLVTVPRHRIRVRGDLANTRAARDAYLHQAIGLMLGGLPLRDTEVPLH